MVEPESLSVRTWAEPAPDWHKVLMLWKEMWLCYTRIFGVLYLFLVLYASTVLWVLRRCFREKKYRLPSLNIMLVFMGLTRSFVFFLNPYSTVEEPSQSLIVFFAILTGIGGACTTSAVSILLLIVLDSTKTTLGPSQFTRLPVFLGITVTNVTYLIISDLIVWFEPKAKPMIIACQVSFSLWGLFITVGYLAAGARIRRNLSASHRMSSYNRCFREQSKGLQSLLRLLYACAVVGVLYFVLSIYSATNNDFGVSNGSAYVKREWDWLGLQTSSRILEISLSVLMLVITTRSLRNEPEDRYVIERTACKTSKRNACSLETRTSHLNREPSLITDLPKFQQVSYV